MRYCRQIIVVALLMHLLSSCWARTRFIPDPWPALAPYWNDADGVDNYNYNNDNDSVERSASSMKTKKAFRNGNHFGNEDRRKKFLGESANFQGGHSLQGLWALPGRR